MILNPDALNQSIYAIQISENDAGRYTCVVKNDTHQIENSIQLDVLSKFQMFYPLFNWDLAIDKIEINLQFTINFSYEIDFQHKYS